MKIDTQPLDDHQVKLVVEISADEFESTKQRAARKLSRRTKIPGFRPGKAPFPVILRHLGENAILEEAIEMTVDEVYPKVIEETGIKPYGPGSLDEIKSMDPPTFEFSVPLKAVVELGDYRSIRVPYEPVQIAEENVDQVLENLREQQAVVEPVDRPAQESDLVYLRLNARLVRIEEDQDPTLINNRSMPVLIEKEEIDNNEEWPFPGFSRQLVGASKGDEKQIVHIFSDDAIYDSFKGEEVEFEFSIEDVRSRTLPELNDELAQSVGEYETLEELRSNIQQSLEQQQSEAYHQDYDDQILEKVVEISSIKYPPQMLEREIDNVIDSMQSRLNSQGLDIDLYMKTRNIDMEGLRAETKPVAETRLQKSLVLLELADVENIQVNPEDLQSETVRTLDEASQYLSEKEFKKLTTQDSTSNLVGNILMDLLIQRTQDRLRDIARGLDIRDENGERDDDSEQLEAETEEEETTVALEDSPAEAQHVQAAASEEDQEIETIEATSEDNE